ncbi:GNAT family N-acetyltransferase [Pseudomonas sp. S36]|uniref:GNAT family N-acetyltransferase n=1 Tax=Pseudomonas sp. S36 TaxID=2767447 RepID=UPI00191489F2|nr:GNAT family protein [Pseudomonas sp. S36]MBK4990552.1 GNAT family N-acetyltransferase [Pseudomonas sp. S36]
MEVIATERLILRPFAKEDAADLFEYLHQPVSSCFLSLALANLQAAECEALDRASGSKYLAVCLRTSGKLIGDLFAEAEDDTFSVGWNFNPAFGGQGYAYEAAAQLFAHLFEQRAARRLYAYVEDTNRSSERLCEKLGMRREGVFKEFVTFMNDQNGLPIYENTQQYALLHHEWAAARTGR